MNIVSLRKVFYAVSTFLILTSLSSLFIYGLNLGVDFRGEALVEVEFSGREVSVDEVIRIGESTGITPFTAHVTGNNSFRIRSRYLTAEDHDRFLGALQAVASLNEKSFISVGPSVGKELRRNAVLAISLSMIAIVLYLAWAFRTVSRPVSSWIYGFTAIVALAHDVIIPTGLFAFLGIQIDSFFVSALLTVIGFSVHDTIVVFDRIRENLRKSAGEKFEAIVGRSLNETITRSINTSMTTVLALLAIYFFGGPTTKDFALALISGIAIGTYSSIFIAAPLLVTIESWKRR